jgi:hypothetical protein
MDVRKVRTAVLAAATLLALAGTARAEDLRFPLATATQAEYARGSTAVILGYDFLPGQSLIVRITRPDGTLQDARGRKGLADTVVADSFGQFGYDYPQLTLTGAYKVDVIDAASVGKGKTKYDGAILASTLFKDNIITDLELVGMPLAQCGANRPPAHGSSPPTPSVGHDGLVDALAGHCLVGTVDIKNTDPSGTVQGFQFSLSPALLSGLQGGGLRPFINRLETVDIRHTPDADTGDAPADPGQGGCASNCYYTTAGNSVIPKVGSFAVTGLDGTQFSIELAGTVTHGPTLEEDYRVTVLSDTPQARFEYCARIDPDAGDGDLGNDGWIDSSPDTGGEEVSPINICQIEDQTPPICEVTLDGDCAVDMLVRDPESGIDHITVTEAINTSIFFYNPFGATPGQGDVISYVPPETGDISAHADKVDCSQYAQTTFEIVNGAGMVTTCDPVDLTIVRANGTPVVNRFTLADDEGLLFINNHRLQEMFIDLNGNRLHFSVGPALGQNGFSMPLEGSASYDLRRFLVAGENVVAIQAIGPPTGSARVALHD